MHTFCHIRIRRSALAFLLVSSSAWAEEEFLQRHRAVSPAGRFERPGLGPLIPGTAGAAISRDGAVWLGSEHGLWRFRPVPAGSLDTKWHYFSGPRYLPDDAVVDLLADPHRPHAVLVRTKTGTVLLDYLSMTLEQKAALFEERVELRHNRFGMVADSAIANPASLASNRKVSSDNDGLWTAMYGASQCFRYAATHSTEALERAVRSVNALLYLEQITGIPGFPARSYIRPGDGEIRPRDGVWYANAKLGLEWKADTSSDEIVGHFFLFSVAYDTLPDPELKRRITATARRIMDHILSHGYYLIDRTGKPTTWGRWSPEYFASRSGRPDSPLNALELLSLLRATRHLTGDVRYDAEYRKAANGLGYAALTTRQLELCHEINYSDEELAMLSFYTLFRYEKDPSFIRTYQQAMDGWWRNISRERNPLWNEIYLKYAAGADGARLLAEARFTLERIPEDLRDWSVNNSFRRDIQWASAKDRFEKPQSLTWIPPDERPVMKWNGNPFVVNGGGGGASEDDGAFFLLPYWLGRYWNFFQ
jgi:hypothetical protein